VTTEVLQQGWPALLEALKSRSKVAFFLLSNTTVVSLEETGLTLRFPKPGDVKGFQSSKHEGLLKEVLHARFGINVMIRAVAGAAPAPGDRHPHAAYNQPAPTQPGPPAATGPLSPSAVPSAAQSAPPSTPQSAGPSGPPEWAVAPSVTAPGNVAPPGNSAPSAPGPTGVSVAQSPSGLPASRQAAVTPVRGHSAVGVASTGTSGALSEEEDVPFPDDDPYAHDDELAGSVNADTELTGISLIERDLGASIIAEYED